MPDGKLGFGLGTLGGFDIGDFKGTPSPTEDPSEELQRIINEMINAGIDPTQLSRQTNVLNQGISARQTQTQRTFQQGQAARTGGRLGSTARGTQEIGGQFAAAQQQGLNQILTTLNEQKRQTQLAGLNAYISKFGIDQNVMLALKELQQQDKQFQQGRSDAALGGIGDLLGTLGILTKIKFKCLPKGTLIDTFYGAVPIEELSVGDDVLVKSGNNEVIIRKHEYFEFETVPERWRRFSLDDGAVIQTCDMHKIEDVEALYYKVGDLMGGKRIEQIDNIYDVKKSYDLETATSKSYTIGGVKVNSMIDEFMYLLGKTLRASKPEMV